MKWGDPVLFWEDAVEKAPASIRGYMNLGVLHSLSGRNISALEVYRQGEKAAKEENPKLWADLFCNIGISFVDLGRYREARPYIEKALSISMDEVYLYNKARLETGLGNSDETLKTLAILEKMNPRYPDLHLMKARAFISQGRYSLARSELIRELTLYPANTSARGLLSRLPAR
jgi:tetratricopeptide (TPR) repeat protein